MNITKIREDFPVLEKKTYFNSAAHGPTLQPVYNAVRDWWKNRINEKKLDPPDVLNEASKLLHCSKEEIVQISRVSQGLNMIAEMMKPQKGENIVVTDLAYQSNVFVWMPYLENGVELKRIPHHEGIIDANDFEKTIDDKTKAVCISEVEWTSGIRYEMKEIADISHNHGAYLINDAYQAVGPVEVNLHRENVDFLVIGSEKWLCCPTMSGILYVRKDIQDEFKSGYQFYKNVEEAFRNGDPWEKPDHDNISSYNHSLYDDARKYNRGTVSEEDSWGFYAALQYFNKLGTENIEKRTAKLTQKLIEGLEDHPVKINTPFEQEKRAGLVTYDTEDFDLNQRIFEKLLSEDIIVAHRYASGIGGIRVSCHFFNIEEEIDRLLDIQARILQI